MALTTNYALHYFGGGVPGAITDDGSAFTAKDPVVLDKLIKALAGHAHIAESRLDDPSEAPAVALATTGGGLAAGTTFYYVVSWVDRFGLETAASAEISVTTQGALDKPSAPIMITNSGGTLPVGSYYYALTALAGDTETPLGPTAIITVSDFKTVNITFPPLPDGATTFSVWRQGPRESAYSRIVATIDPVANPTFNDDGTILADPQAYDPTHQAPTANTTNATNAVTITTPEASFVSTDPSSVKAWRIYRTTTSGAYPASSLVTEVRTTVNADGTGGLVTTFVDTGLQALASGAPLNTSQTFLPPGEISTIKVDTIANLPDAGQYQDGVLAVATTDKKLSFALAGAWVTLGGGGVTVVNNAASLPDPTQFEDGSLAVTESDKVLYVCLSHAWQASSGSGSGGSANSVILTSPDNSAWALSVDNDGVVSATKTNVSLNVLYTEDFAPNTAVPVPPWTQFVGSPLVADSSGHLPFGSGGSYYYELGTTNQAVKVTYANLSNYLEVLLGVGVGGHSFLSVAIYAGGTIDIWQYANDNYTTTLNTDITGSMDSSGSGTVTAICNGPRITILVNDQPYCTATLPTNSLSSTKVGFQLPADSSAFLDQIVLMD